MMPLLDWSRRAEFSFSRRRRPLTGVMMRVIMSGVTPANMPARFVLKDSCLVASNSATVYERVVSNVTFAA